MSTAGQQGSLSARLAGTQYDTTILNQLLQQQSAAQRAEASLHQRSLLQSLLPSPGANSNILSVALQQEIAASLSNSNFQLLSNVNRSSPGSLVGGGLLSRQEQELAMLRRLAGSASTSGKPSLVQSIGSRDAENSIVEGQKASNFIDSSVQLPCQARGMAADHNASTAYFEIPSNATHGQHLLCSHPACRAAGVKFRYCLFCKKPVTKQNFRSRHLHADMENAQDINASVVGEDEAKAPAPRKRPPKKRAPVDFGSAPDRKSPLGPASHSLKPPVMVEPDVVVPDTIPDVNARMEGLQSQRPAMDETDDLPVLTSTREVGSVATKKSTPAVDDALRVVMRRRRWISLLSERPASFQGMDSWVSEVISVSDTSKPFELKASGLSDGAVSSKVSVDLLSNWSALLGQRPKSDDGKAVTAWLTRVLDISCPSKTSRPAPSPPSATSGIAAGKRSINVKAGSMNAVQEGSGGRLLKKMKHADFD